MNPASMRRLRAATAILILAASSGAAQAQPRRAPIPSAPPVPSAPPGAPSAPVPGAPSGAPTTSTEDSDRADALVRQANALAKKDQWGAAAPLFQQAWDLKHSYDIAGNLGLAESELGKWPQAAEHLRFALGGFPVNGKPEHRKLLEQAFAQARAEVGALRIEVNLKGAQVLVDGEEVGVSPLEHEVFVAAGAHDVEARLPGHPTAKQAAQVTKGEMLQVALAVQEPPPERDALAALQPTAGTGPRSLLPVLVGGGLAVVGVGLGVGLTIAANDKSDDVAALRAGIGTDWACARPLPEAAAHCADLRGAIEDRDTLSNAAVGAFIAGGALAAAAGGYFVWQRLGRKDARSTAWAAPIVGSHEAGAAVGGSF